MPPVIAAAGGFLTALTGGVIAFGAPTAAFAAGVAAAGFATSGIGSLLITGALTVGANLLSRGQAAQAGAVNSPESRGSVKQAIPPQRVLYGAARIGGALFYENDLTPPYLVWGLLHSARRISNVRALYVGTTVATFDSLGAANSPPFLKAGVSRLQWSFRSGSAGQAIDPIILATDPAIDANFRQRGVATSVFKATFGDDADDFSAMWGTGSAIPNILIDAEGATVHDPREPSSDPADESTWPYRNNAALVQADWLRQPYGGKKAQTQLRWDEIARAADYDDELVALSDGTFQKRYTADGLIDLSQDPNTIAEQLMTANRGFVATDQGRMWVTSSPPQDPIATLKDSDCRGGLVYVETQKRDAILNTVRTRFVAPDREYNIADGPVRDDTGYLAADGEVLDATLGLFFTTTHQRAQRIAELQLRQSRLQKRITTALPTRRAMGMRPGQVVNFASTLVPRASGIYQIEAIGYSEDYTNRPVTLSQYDATLAGLWTPADEKPFVLVDIDA